MANPNALIERVRELSVSSKALAGMAAEARPQTVTVTFQDGRSGRLDFSRAHAEVWAEMLDFVREHDQPAYVEIDPPSGTITELLLPQSSKVMFLGGTAGGDVQVSLIPSPAVHYLRASNPDFATLREALETARAGGTEVLVTATRQREIIDIRPLPKVSVLKAPPAPAPTPPGVLAAVTEERAQELFDLMNATTCDCSVVPPCIPFKYPEDGCYARAHEMCRLMGIEGEAPQKVWIYGFPKGSATLMVNTANEPIHCYVQWWYHVAPTLLVDVSGVQQKMVIDPSLCSAPVTPEDWKALQGDPNATLEYTDATPFWPDGTPDPNYSLTNFYLQQKRLYLKQDHCDLYGPPPYSCPIKKQISFITDRSTFGEDEVTAMLAGGSPAVIEAAFYIVVDGFSPQDLGITSYTPPNQAPQFAPAPPAAGMSIKVVKLAAEFPQFPQRRQRLTWTCNVEFTSKAGFTVPIKTITLTASIASLSASALIQLIQQPNPFEMDGATSWLSTDLRVFQINEGAQRFGATMGSGAAAASTFIQQVIANLKSGAAGSQTFDTISTDQQTSHLELAETINGTAVYNFAVAKVRYRGLLDAQNVRVFFRLMPASSTSTEYQPASTYRTGGQSGVKVPLLGIAQNTGDLATIPCFAYPRVNSSAASLNQQTDPANVQTIAAGAAEHSTYFGCWLDINQVTPQFPTHPVPADGPFPSGRVSVQDLVRNQHQCLVAEIAFDPDPIQTGVSPATSDKLAQRNLAIVPAANPGTTASRSIPLTFEVRPSPADGPPDELMIHWGNTPEGSHATVYLPEVDVKKVFDLAKPLYGCPRFERVDDHTIGCRAAGVTYIPIPPGGHNFVGLLMLDLPLGVRRDQAFTIVTRQITNATGKPPVVIEVAETAAATTTLHWRKVLGAFQLTVPVRNKETMLEPEERLLGVLRSIQKSMPENDRWRPVFQRYVGQVAHRVDALGGHSADIKPSPSGVDVCLRLRIVDEHGAFFAEPVDIEIKHRTLESVPRREIRHVVPTNVFLVRGLRRFPQSDYVVTVTPTEWFHPEGQFVTIPSSGAAELTFAFRHRAAHVKHGG